MDLIAYALAKKYTDKSIEGGGAVKGKNCTISSIEPIEGGNRVTFQWTLDNGVIETETMDVMDGEDGADGSQVTESDTNGNIVVDGTEIQVYNDTKVKDAISDIDDIITTDETTIEGNPLNFTTLSAQTAESTLIDLEPIQNLHGYSKPWVGGAGKNKLPMTVSNLKAINTVGSWSNNEYTINGVKFTVLTDNDNNVIGIAAVGANTGGANFYLASSFNPGSSVIMSGCPSGGGENTYVINWQGNANDTGSGVTINTPNTGNVRVQILTNSTVNLIFYPMIRLSTESDATFQPYTNECGISGRSEIGILGCGESIIPNETDTSKGYISGAYLKSDGTTGGTISNFVSEYFDIKGGAAYVLYDVIHSANAASVCFYDKDKVFISGVAIERTTKYINAPQNAKYARCTQFINIAEDEIVFAYGSNNLTISLGQTVYGGTLDVENGVLVVDRAIQDLGNCNWTYWTSGSSSVFYTWHLNELAKVDANTIPICSHYKGMLPVDANGDAYNNGNGTCEFRYPTFDRFYIRDDRYNDEIAFKTALNGVQLCYKLATPITINLTPNVISLLEGVNNISTTGDKITLTYRDGKVATLGDLTSAVDGLDGKIDESKILTDTETGTKYKLVVTDGVLGIEEVTEPNTLLSSPALLGSSTPENDSSNETDTEDNNTEEV